MAKQFKVKLTKKDGEKKSLTVRSRNEETAKKHLGWIYPGSTITEIRLFDPKRDGQFPEHQDGATITAAETPAAAGEAAEPPPAALDPETAANATAEPGPRRKRNGGVPLPPPPTAT